MDEDGLAYLAVAVPQPGVSTSPVRLVPRGPLRNQAKDHGFPPPPVPFLHVESHSVRLPVTVTSCQ